MWLLGKRSPSALASWTRLREQFRCRQAWRKAWVTIRRRHNSLSITHTQCGPGASPTWGVKARALRRNVVRPTLHTRARLEIGEGEAAECLLRFPRHLNNTIRVAYADPPWRYDGVRAAGDYPTMTLKQIKDLPVNQLAAETAVLCMWTTSPMLQNALSVVRAWGFDYKTIMHVWTKRTPQVFAHVCCACHTLLTDTPPITVICHRASGWRCAAATVCRRARCCSSQHGGLRRHCVM